MSGLDPCAVLTDGEVALVGVKVAQRFANPPESWSGNEPTCTWQSGTGWPPHSGIYVQGVTYRSFADVRADPSFPQQQYDLRGFPAVTRQNSYSSKTISCQVFVDVADGQTFEVAYDIDDDTSQATVCERAKQAADFGMSYLLARG
jgi:hypothetical protein